MKNHYFIYILLVCFIPSLNAQDPEPYEIRRESYITKNFQIEGSPEPSNLGFYADFNHVNRYNGALQLNVPIYQLSSKWVKVPIGLNYNGQGAKLLEEAGYAGYKWSLQAGGSITRQTQGMPDMLWNYYDHSDDVLHPQTFEDDLEENTFLEDIAEAEIESQPDHYYASFGKFSFKFYIAANREIYMPESQDLDIQIEWDDFDEHDVDLLKFTIRDTDGTTYHFETVEYTEQYKDDGNLNSWVWSEARFMTFNSTWWLTKIEPDKGGEIIELDYHTATSYYTPPYGVYQYYSRTHSEDTSGSCNACNKDPDGRVNAGGPDDIRIYDRRHLEKISLKKDGILVESVEFTPQTPTCTTLNSGKQLDKITVKRHAGSNSVTLLTFDLDYDCTANRLSLRSITETGGSGTSKPPWQFDYNTTALPDMSLSPHYVQMDHWGFVNNNGASNNLGPTLIPAVYSGPNTYGDNAFRQSNFNRTRGGMLEKVTYPTNGYTEFEYETNIVAAFNDHTHSSGQNTIAGGLRVASIIHYDSDGTPLTKRSYKYRLSDTNNNSSGKLLQCLNYLQLGSFTNYSVNQTGCPVTTTCNTATVLANTTPTNSGGSSNDIVGYSRVEEIISDASGGTTTAGRTVYHFHNEKIDSDYDVIENGQLDKKEIYDDAGNLLVETLTTYSTDLPNQTSLPRYKSFTKFKVIAKDDQDNETYLCRTGSGPNDYEWREPDEIIGCQYRQYFANKYRRDEFVPIEQKWIYQTGQTETRYFYDSGNDQTGSVQTVTSYLYGDEKVTLPTEITVTNSNGEAFKTVNGYLSSANGSNSFFTNMETDYRWAEPVSTKHYINSSLVYQSRLEYGAPSGEEMPIKLYETFGSEPERLAETFDLRDDLENIRRAFRKGQEPSAMVYSNYLCRAAARVQNADYDEVAFTSFDTDEAVQGDWAITGDLTGVFKINANAAYSGSGYLYPDGGNTITIIEDNLPPGIYRLSYAKKGSISVGLTNGVVYNNTQAPIDASGWTYVVNTLVLSNSSNSITLLVKNAELDELRLHPIDALMSTASFDRYSRLIDGIVDESGIPTQITYDDLLRPTAFKNFDKHFLKHLKYEYEADAGFNHNAVKTYDILIDGVTSVASVDALSVANTEVQPLFGYIDGIGREIQRNAVQQSPSLADIINPMPYDDFGRQVKRYLPYTLASNNGTYRSSAITEQESFCSAQFGIAENDFGLTELDLELSPLNRVLKEYPPGADFVNHPKITTYGTNAVSEVRNFHGANLWFAPNELYKVTQTDENGNLLTSFTDKLGRVVMQDREGRKTYFLYNSIGKQEQVITPEGAKLGHDFPYPPKNDTDVEAHSYLYTYDVRHRMKTKTVPGALAYEYYYNELDQLVLTKDGNGFQEFTKYDALLRPIMTGKYNGLAVPQTTDPTFEVRTTNGPHYYSTNLSFPTNNIEIYTVQYYDDYNFNNDNGQSPEASYQTPSANGNFYPVSNYPFAGGKLTATKTGLLNNGGTAPITFLETYSFYDKFGRIIHTQSDHHLNGQDLEWNAYNYPGWLLRTRREHDAVTSKGNQSLIINQRFTYDHTGREKQSYYELNDSGSEQLICEKDYNERDELETKKLGGLSGSSFLQTVDYEYNIRKWMTKMNDVDNQGSDLFALELIYGEGDEDFSQILYGSGANANYNGNITMMKWSGAGSDKQVYGFTYDALNRLTFADYGLQTGSSTYDLNHTYLGEYSYDDNGNIKTIRRNSVDGTMDDMILDYTLNGQLTSITETGDKAQGFVTQNSDNSPYDFDANGNMTKDPDKRLKMGYNYLNLPHQLSPFENGPALIEWLYDAMGNKLQKKVLIPNTLDIDDNPMASREYTAKQTITSSGVVANDSDVTFTAGTSVCLENGFEVELGAEFLAQTEPQLDFTRDYIGSIEYLDGEIETVYHEAGRVAFIGGNAEFQYRLEDHLGNTRVLFKDKGNGITKILQENHYYAFGMEMKGNWNNTTNPTQSYLYNNKELNTDFGLNWLFYGVRCYDPATARFTGVDPISNKFPWVSTYNYAENSPIANIDLWGLQKWNTTSGVINGPYRNQEQANHAAQIQELTSGFSSEEAASSEEETTTPLEIAPVTDNNKGNISQTSFGETAGIYPTKNTKNPKNAEKYDPSQWDEEKTRELLEARAGIDYIGDNRNTDTQSDNANLNDPIERTVAPYHLEDNFPEVAPEIKNDSDVKYFYLGQKTDKHPGISSKYWNQTTVKTYGPFFNDGGGDAPRGEIYIMFYKATPKSD